MDPATRYPTLNKKLVLPFQVTHLVDTDNPSLIEEELALASKAASSNSNSVDLDQSLLAAKRRRRKESHVSPDALLAWFQKQLESYDCVAVSDMTYSFQSGLALCAVVHRYRPDLVEFQALDPSTWAENNQLAFDLLEHELGVPPAMTGRELASSKNPDKLAMISYLSQVYELFRKEIPASALPAVSARLSEEDLLEDSQYRHNHPRHNKGVRRKYYDSGKSGAAATSIGQLVAGEAATRKKKRRSREERLSSSGPREEEAAAAAAAEAGDTNMQETLRMNRSAHKRRLQKLQEAAERTEAGRKQKQEATMRQSIKKDDRYKAIEEKFGASGSRRRQHHVEAAAAKSREDKKPKDLKRAIGKLDKDDWNIRNIEGKMTAGGKKSDGEQIRVGRFFVARLRNPWGKRPFFPEP